MLTLSQVTQAVFMLDIVIGFAIVTLIAYVVLDADQSKWVYLVGHCLLQLEEFFMVLSFLLFVSKKEPKNFGSESSNTSDTAKEMQKSDSTESTRSEAMTETTLDIPLSNT